MHVWQCYTYSLHIRRRARARVRAILRAYVRFRANRYRLPDPRLLRRLAEFSYRALDSVWSISKFRYHLFRVCHGR